jgi:predicted acyltransferase
MEQTNSKRLLSLDILRGITIVGMILVNNPGGDFVFAPLKHAQWIGLTPTDFVFPFFLFIMGISTYLSLRKYDFKLTKASASKIIRRSVLLYLVGLIITWFDLFCNNWNLLAAQNLPFGEHFYNALFDFAHIRILGVLERLAICYFIGSFIVLTLKSRLLPWLIAVLYIGYFIILQIGNGFEYNTSNILYHFDDIIMGPTHMFKWDVLDPEGFLSTIPAIAHFLIGYCVGRTVMNFTTYDKKIEFLFVVGLILTLSGVLLSFGCPVSKKIWSPSFSLITCGTASSLLALLMWIIDLNGHKSWCPFFESFGVNPLFLYTLSEILAISFGFIHIPFGPQLDIHKSFYNIYLQLFGDYGASLLYSIIFVLLNGAFGYILYKKKIYIKL